MQQSWWLMNSEAVVESQQNIPLYHIGEWDSPQSPGSFFCGVWMAASEKEWINPSMENQCTFVFSQKFYFLYIQACHWHLKIKFVIYKRPVQIKNNSVQLKKKKKNKIAQIVLGWSSWNSWRRSPRKKTKINPKFMGGGKGQRRDQDTIKWLIEDYLNKMG